MSVQETGPKEQWARDRISDESPSAKLVFLVLERAEGTLSTGELAERTLLPNRTVRYALDTLSEHDLVRKRPDFTDNRKHRIELVEEP